MGGAGWLESAGSGFTAACSGVSPHPTPEGQRDFELNPLLTDSTAFRAPQRFQRDGGQWESGGDRAAHAGQIDLG